MKKILIISILPLLLFACKDDQPVVPEPVIEKFTTVVFEFENTVDGAAINLDTTVFTNKLGQPYTIDAWKYFISNIKFYANGNLVYAEKDSYHYINQDDPESLEFKLNDVPAGEYDEIHYSFGIDSIHNHGDSANGDIDPGTGMFWPMGGYRFSNFDGENNNNALAYHVGGNSNYFEMTFNSNIYMIVEEGNTTMVHNMVNLSEMFTNPNDIDFTQSPNLATEATAAPIAENMANGMFMIHHIENPN